MRIRPAGDRFVVKLEAQPERSVTLSIYTEDGDLRGEVVAIGRDTPPELSVGDTVQFSRYVGREVVTEDGVLLVLKPEEIRGLLI